MKRILFVSIMAVVSVGLFAIEPAADAGQLNPISVSGSVNDIISGESLTGVKLQLEGSDIVEYTDFDGRFEINDLKPGKYTVLVEYISYDTKKIEKLTLDSKSDKNLKIELQPSTVKLGSEPN